MVDTLATAAGTNSEHGERSLQSPQTVQPRYDVDYDDGCRETDLPIARIRIVRAPPAF
eukprot:CAMPEP_0175029006 /NCGR_PEP_ID=MMETSP0005-20121125/19340_1 /TAXON_ID=420556 /ORGANISM="Ochromonas sp., Strain CCMP1393" /LENGTH=57 /DNA_ID=CAMNT_0016288737 /DNA_START=16 /DNA_END=186 /DNA_ORIENTATION=+